MKHLSKNLRRALILAAAAVMLVGTAAAASTATKKMIEANYMGIKLVVDGAEVTPKDGNGKPVDPFISDGTTYLPVRAVGEALGKEVTWDGATKTVYIGKVPGAEENWMTKLPPYRAEYATVYDGSDHTKTFEVAGVTQTLGVVAHDKNGWNKPEVIWNTNGQYSTMNFTIGYMRYTGDKVRDLTLEVYLDGEYSTSYDFKYDGAPKTISIPLNYAPNVKLLFTSNNGKSGTGSEWGIYDLSFS